MGTSLYEQYLAEQGEPKPVSLYEQYQRETKAKRPSLELDIRMPAESSRALPHNRPNRADDVAPFGMAEGSGSAALGILASGAQAIPGMEALQAGARSVVRGQPYEESLRDMRGVTDEIPAPIKLAAQIPAMAAGAGVMGKVAKLRSPAKGGAILGAADQALDADNVSLEDRLKHTAAGAVGGAALGKTLDMLVTGGRAVAAKRYGDNLNARTDALSAASKGNYGAATKEMTAALQGNTGPTSPLSDALLDPAVVPFTKAVRSTQQFAQADDATVLREVYKLMSERQRAMGARMLSGEDFKAGTALEKKEIEAAKQSLLRAADVLGKGFRKAVESHAKMQGEIDALKHGKEAARQAIGKLEPSSMKGQRMGPAALRKKAPQMALEERIAADEGALGQLKRSIGPEASWISGFGAATTALRPMRVGPLLRAIDAPKQRLLDDLVRSGLVGGTTLVP